MRIDIKKVGIKTGSLSGLLFLNQPVSLREVNHFKNIVEQARNKPTNFIKHYASETLSETESQETKYFSRLSRTFFEMMNRAETKK